MASDRSARGLRTCVTCGRQTVRRQALRMKDRGGRLVEVEVDVCRNCGEQYFDLVAMRLLEQRRAR